MPRLDQQNSKSAAAPAQAAQRPSPAASRWGTWVAAALLALAVFAVYYNSLSAAFVLDDHLWIEENPNILHLWPIGPLFAPSDPGQFGGRPVISLTLALNHALGGTNPWGYHAVNLVIHILAVLALFGVIRRTLRLPLLERQFGAAATPLAFAAALLWAVHPLQTQAVTYVIQRTESLAGLFYLLTLYCVLRGATASRRALGWYVAAILSCMFGAGTKEIIATAPLVVLLYDRTFLSGTFRAAIARRWGLYAGLSACWIVSAALLIATSFHGGSTGLQVKEFTPLTYLLTQPGVLLHYLRLAFWPSGQCLDYGWPAAHGPMEIILPGLVIVGLLALTVWAIVKRPALGFLGAWFFIILAPTSSFVPILDAAFEHRMYLSLAAITTLVVLGGWTLWPGLLTRLSGNAASEHALQWAGPLAILAAASIGLGWATVRRNALYGSEIAVMQDSLNKSPNNVRALASFADKLTDQGQSADAVVYLNRALEIDPNYVNAMINLGKALDKLGKYDQAVEQYEKWIHLVPKSADAHYNLGLTLNHQGKFDQAIENFQRALEINPRFARAYDGLGIALYQQKKTDLALAQWRKAIEIDPNFADARINFGTALYELHQFDQAVVQFQRAVEINRENSDTRDRLANALSHQGKTSEAIAEWQKLLKADPQAVKARIHLALALHREGRKQEAADQWRAAIRFANAGDAGVLYDAAEILAYGSDPSLHNSRGAIELGQAAARLTGFQNPEILELLAAAHANLGEFTTAAQIAGKAHELAIAQKNDALAKQIQPWAEFFQKRAMHRDATPPPSAP